MIRNSLFNGPFRRLTNRTTYQITHWKQQYAEFGLAVSRVRRTVVNNKEFPAIPSRFAALAFLLFALELAQSSSPNVPPLNDQAVFVGQQSRAFGARGTLSSAQDEEAFAHVYSRTFAGQILHVDPQHVIASLQRLSAALVHGHQTHGKFGPVADGLHVQHADLDSYIYTREPYTRYD